MINLPKGQAFALLEGGQLWKIRMPLPLPDKTEDVPRDVADIAARMRAKYATGDQWWEGVMPPPIHLDFTHPPSPSSKETSRRETDDVDVSVSSEGVNHGEG